QSVHRVENEPADSDPSLSPVADHMVEDRVEERLGLARAGASCHQSRLRSISLAEAAAAQPFECACLVSIGLEFSRSDLECVPSSWLRFEGCTGANEWALEDSGVRITEELVEGRLHFSVGEGEGGPQVFGE